MTTIEHILEVLSQMVGTPTFRRRFSAPQLLREPAEVERVRENLPSSLLPFMREENPGWWDIYALDMTDPLRERVVVWADNAVVAEWSSFDEFLKWIREELPGTSGSR